MKLLGSSWRSREWVKHELEIRDVTWRGHEFEDALEKSRVCVLERDDLVKEPVHDVFGRTAAG